MWIRWLANVSLIPTLMVMSHTAVAQDSQLGASKSKVNACLLVAVMSARPEQTVGELIEACKNDATNRVKKRQALEKDAASNPFALLPHKPNFILPLTLTSIRREPYEGVAVGPKLDNLEAKFQVSLKYIAWQDFIFRDLDLQFAFTSTSWWQSYNDDISAPFRETNYEPELILSYKHSWSLLGLPVEHTYLSFNHQSNG